MLGWMEQAFSVLYEKKILVAQNVLYKKIFSITLKKKIDSKKNSHKS